jgi:hypothetical protein
MLQNCLLFVMTGARENGTNDRDSIRLFGLSYVFPKVPAHRYIHIKPYTMAETLTASPLGDLSRKSLTSNRKNLKAIGVLVVICVSIVRVYKDPMRMIQAETTRGFVEERRADADADADARHADRMELEMPTLDVPALTDNLNLPPKTTLEFSKERLADADAGRMELEMPKQDVPVKLDVPALTLNPNLPPILPQTTTPNNNLSVNYFKGTDNCPLESLPTTREWMYFQDVAKTNNELGVAARPFSPSSSPPIASKPQIPHRLIFTHRYNLFDNCDPSSRDHLKPELHMLAANARQTVALYREFWGEPEAEVTFLTDVDCIRVINATEPRLIKHFLKEKGMYKADICRVAELYLRGGYYFDIDLLAVHPVSPANSVRFTTVKGCGWPKKGFFQAFSASAPGHPILKKSLDILLEVYQGKRKRKGWIGPETMQIAYEQYMTETLPEVASQDLLLLEEVAFKWVKKKKSPKWLLKVPQQPQPKRGFKSGVCNFVVYDNSTQYFFSRVNGTAWCGGKDRKARAFRDF